jgi:hypothetical protein
VQSLLWRISTAVLWIFLAVGSSAHLLLVLALPGTLDEVLAGRVGGMEITTGMMILVALFWVVAAPSSEGDRDLEQQVGGHGCWRVARRRPRGGPGAPGRARRSRPPSAAIVRSSSLR